MADFCKQCNETLFGTEEEGFINDAKGLITEKEYNEENIMAAFLCESCGVTFVNHEGTCLTKCIRKHGSIEIEE